MENILCIIENFRVYLASNRCDKQNPEIISKKKEIKFSGKFAQEMKFHKNGGSFEMKLNIRDAIK